MTGSRELHQLVTAAQAGDGAAVEDILRQAARLAFSRVRRMLGASEAAEDLTQDVLVVVLKGLPGLRDPQAFLPWLRSIVDNTVADHLSRERKRLLQPEPRATAVPPGSHDGPEQYEEARRLRTALGALQPRNRLAIELFYFRDLTCKQVAEFLDISNDAARTALSRTRKELKRRLSEVSTTEQPRGKTYTYVVEVRNAEECTFRGGPFQGDERAQDLYMALYPEGDPAAAARAAGVPPESLDEKLRFLQEMRLIIPQDGAWRCTMPVVNAADAELIRPWAEPIAEALLGQLDPAREELTAISGRMSGELAQRTVMAAGILAEATRRPLNTLREQLRTSAPERGRFGRFCTAAFAKTSRQALGGIHAAEQEGSLCYFLWPTQTRRPGVARLVHDFPTPPGKAPTDDAVVDCLARHALEPLAPHVRDHICDELMVPCDRRAQFWQLLEELHAVGIVAGEMQVALPRVPMAEWTTFTARLDALGREISDRIADSAEDLRRRAAVSSFANCFFADAVFAFFAYLDWAIKKEIAEKQWLQLPGEADFSWGTLLVL